MPSQADSSSKTFGQHNDESRGDILQWLCYVQFFFKEMFLRFSCNFPAVSNFLPSFIYLGENLVGI